MLFPVDEIPSPHLETILLPFELIHLLGTLCHLSTKTRGSLAGGSLRAGGTRRSLRIDVLVEDIALRIILADDDDLILEAGSA